MRVAISPSLFYVVSAATFSLGGKLLLQCGVPPMEDSSSQTSPTSTGSFCGQQFSCPSSGFPESHKLLQEQFPALVWGPWAANWTLLHCWSVRAARAQPLISQWAPACLSLPSLLTWYPHDVFLLSHSSPKQKEHSKQRSLLNRLFPLKYIIEEALIGSEVCLSWSRRSFATPVAPSPANKTLPDTNPRQRWYRAVEPHF